MSMNEYVSKFTQLSHYTPHEVDTDEKKQKCFLNGLNDGLAYAFEARDFENFQGPWAGKSQRSDGAQA
jgi:hypothetical protein